MYNKLGYLEELFTGHLFIMFISAFFATAAFLGALATPVSDFVLHEARESIPQSFVYTGVASGDQILNMRINLAQNNLDGLQQALESASTPSSPKFRQWLSSEQVEDFVKPSADTVNAVSAWLSQNNIVSKSITPAGDWISFSIPVSKANEMLNANYAVYAHKASGKQNIRTMSYSLPADLVNHINAVHPTTSFTGPLRGLPAISPAIAVPASSEKLAPGAVPSSCSSAITPACLQALYSIPLTPATNAANVLGVVGMDDQFANKADLKSMLTKYRPDMSSATTFSLTSVDGGVNTQTLSDAGIEADLDIQYTVGIATDVPTTFVSVGESNQDGADEGFLDVINALLAETAPPTTLTTSYGFDVESDLSLKLSVALCNSYMQLTSRGTSIMFATGDGGVASTPGVQCSSKFPPTFPTCPYVTLVGATQGSPETGASLSAGGFSNYFAQTSWQASAVNAYLAFLGTEYSGKYNKSGRAYPDVSAQGENVQVFVGGSLTSVAGTSCSSPIFTSVIALLNDQLLSAGLPVLGFLNPWLYANPGAFNDITTGSNPGCGTSGFPATTGWDPVTGLGSPNYAKLRTAAGLS